MRGDNLVQMEYIGARLKAFEVVAGVTRTRYFVPGGGELVEIAKSGQQGVIPPDVRWFLTVDRGKAYQLYTGPAPKPKAKRKPRPRARPKPEPAPEPEPVEPEQIQGPDTGLAELDAEIEAIEESEE